MIDRGAIGLAGSIIKAGSAFEEGIAEVLAVGGDEVSVLGDSGGVIVAVGGG